MKKPEQGQLLEWIQRSRQGDPEAQEALILAAQNRVYYHCKKMLKQEQDAQDAAQDVLITMITSLDKLKEPAAFWGWVNGITANRCRHLLSAPHKEWQIPEDEEGNSMLDSLENLDEQLVPEKALDNDETRRMILELVDNLSPEQRMCVLFYYYDEMSIKDIAQAMETSEGTVKSRLNYARKAIKAGVEDYERKGIKLYSVSPILLLVYCLRQEGAAFLLDPASAAAMVGQVMTQAGGAAAVAAGTAAGSTAAVGSTTAAGTAAAAGETAAAAGSAAAAGTAAGEAAAAAAGGAAAGGAVAGGTAAGAAAGVSAKVVAGVLAGLVAVGGATAGLTTLMTPKEEAATSSVETVVSAPMPQAQPESVVEEVPQEAAEEEPQEEEQEETPEEQLQQEPEPIPQPEPEPEPEPEPTPFAVARGLSIGSPATYSSLPATPVCSDPDVTTLPSTCTISAPSISTSAPDASGNVTYTVSYNVTTKCHLGTTKAEPVATPYTIWYESYNVYDYYTGSTYFAPHLDTVGGQTSDGASATGEHNGQSFSVTCQASAQKLAEAGSDWVESQSAEYTYEIHSDMVYRITMTVRAPANYDGLMLGLNVVDAPNPSAAASSLTSGSLSHYRFVRLG